MLRWYQRLATKVIGVGAIFFALTVISLGLHYLNLKHFFIESNRIKAAVIAENVTTTLTTLIGETERGGALINGLVKEINSKLEGASVRIVHSRAVETQYGVDNKETPRNEAELATLLDGKPRKYEDDEYFSYIVPVKAGRKCLSCHRDPDDAFHTVPVGYILGLAVAQVSKLSMNAELNRVAAYSIALVVLISLIFAVHTFFTYRHLVHPLSTMVGVINEIANGKTKRRVHIKQRDEIGLLADNFNVMADKLDRSSREIVKALAEAIEAKDPYTRGHCNRVARFSLQLGREIGLNEDQLGVLEYGALLHDVGKIGVRGAVLGKQGGLDDSEYKQIKEHPEIGDQILSSVEFLSAAREIVRHHHERADGRGYPDHLDKGHMDSMLQIVIIADAYDAITSDRPYRKGMPVEKALQILRDNKGNQFNGELVDIFINKKLYILESEEEVKGN